MRGEPEPEGETQAEVQEGAHPPQGTGTFSVMGGLGWEEPEPEGETQAEVQEGAHPPQGTGTFSVMGG